MIFMKARVLTEAAKKYKVVTQMGNQGSSWSMITRNVEAWIQAGVIGDVAHSACMDQSPGMAQGIADSRQESLIYRRS
jgi:hypothetical protein